MKGKVVLSNPADDEGWGRGGGGEGRWVGGRLTQSEGEPLWLEDKVTMTSGRGIAVEGKEGRRRNENVTK